MSETNPQPDRAELLNADEHTLYWELFGDGSREIVCLLNGLAMQTPAWYGFLQRLRPDYEKANAFLIRARRLATAEGLP